MTEVLSRQVLAFFMYFGQLTLLHGETWWSLVRGRLNLRHTVNQMAEVGIGSLPIAIVTLMFGGAVMTYHLSATVGRFGASSLVGYAVAETMTRELGPVLAAFVVAARAGSAMAAEIGTMKVTEQIDALRAMATDPVQYLVAPRYVAALVMVPMLAFIGDVVGVLGGYVVSAISPFINESQYFTGIQAYLEPWAVVGGLIKAVAFGMIIALVGCHQGLNCRMASEEVGRATTRSVVYSIMLIYAADFVLTAILFRM